jgi:hypothetical protein
VRGMPGVLDAHEIPTDLPIGAAGFFPKKEIQKSQAAWSCFAPSPSGGDRCTFGRFNPTLLTATPNKMFGSFKHHISNISACSSTIIGNMFSDLIIRCQVPTAIIHNHCLTFVFIGLSGTVTIRSPYGAEAPPTFGARQPWFFESTASQVVIPSHPASAVRISQCHLSVPSPRARSCCLNPRI